MLKVLSLRATKEDYDRWRANARDAGLCFGEWARRRLNGPVPEMPNLAKVISTPSLPREPIVVNFEKGTAVRREKCEHRIPPGAYCKSCERIKK